LKAFPSFSGEVSWTGDFPALEVPESSSSSLFLLFFGEAAEGSEREDSAASVSTSFSEEAADL
jgi:hypothetical protein